MSDSLMGNIDSAEQNTQATTSSDIDNNVATQSIENTGEQPSWFFAEGVPGQGDKPEFLDAKFKNLAEQARSYKELEKKFGGFRGAPENYELALPEEVASKVNINTQDPLYQSIATTAKELNMSQDGFNKLVGNYAAQIAQQNEARLQQEMQALGEKGGERLRTLGQWADNNLEPEESQLLKQLVVDANTVKLFEKIRSKMTSRIPDSTKEATGISAVDEEENIRNMMRGENYQKYISDPVYRAEVERRRAAYYGENE